MWNSAYFNCQFQPIELMIYIAKGHFELIIKKEEKCFSSKANNTESFKKGRKVVKPELL